MTMDAQSVNFVQPFPELQAEFPVIYTEILDQPATASSPGGKNVTSEEALKTAGKTYTFDFDSRYSVMFMLSQQEMTIIQTRKELLARIHLMGMPHSKFGDGRSGTSGSSTLTVQ